MSESYAKIAAVAQERNARRKRAALMLAFTALLVIRARFCLAFASHATATKTLLYRLAVSALAPFVGAGTVPANPWRPLE